MADPLSIIASLIAVVQISGKVISCCYDYRKAFKSAPRDVVRTLREVTDLRNVIERLIKIVDEEATTKRGYLPSLVAMTSSADGPFALCQAELQALHVKLEKPVSEWQALGKRLIWPLQEKEISKALETTRRTKDIIESALLADNTQSILAIRESTRELQERVNDFAHRIPQAKDVIFEEFIAWLNAPDQSPNHNRALGKRQADTGQWFLDRSDYQNWKTKPGLSFWIHGIPGCGKTVLCSTIIEDVTRIRRIGQAFAVVYYYFDFGDQRISSIDCLLRSMIVQLLIQSAQIPDIVENLLEKYHLRRRFAIRFRSSLASPSMEELMELLRQTVDGFDHVYMIVDALDECTERYQLLQFISKFAGWGTGKIHFLMTSRDESDLEESPNNKQHTRLNIASTLVEADIRLFVERQLQNDPQLRKWPSKVQVEIQTALVKGSQGIAVAAMLHSERHQKGLGVFTGDAGRDVRSDFRKYELHILPLCFEIIEVAHRLTSAFRLQEAIDILAIDLDDVEQPKFDKDLRLPDGKDILTMCAGLVSMSTVIVRKCSGSAQEEIQELRLSHSSVKEFLISHYGSGPVTQPSLGSQHSHRFVALCCLAYLLQFNVPLNLETSQNFPLARYAAQNWMFHLDSSTDESFPLVEKWAMELMDGDGTLYKNWHQLYDPDRPWRPVEFKKSSIPMPIYYTALVGSERLSELLLKSGADPNAPGGILGRPLHAASYYGHEGVVKMLLVSKADLGPSSGIFRYPLTAAASGGREVVMRILLEHGADPNIREFALGTSLLQAAIRGYANIVQLLLDSGANPNVNSPKATFLNPLVAATEQGHQETVLLLLPKATGTIRFGVDALARGASREMIQIYCKLAPDTTLRTAAECGLEDILAKLLDQGALKTSIGIVAYNDLLSSALVEAAGAGHQSVARRLIGSGADVNARSGSTCALATAAQRGHSATVKLLLENKADMNALARDGDALQLAAYEGHEDIVQELLNFNALLNQGAGPYGSALQAASKGGNYMIVDYLLERGAAVDANTDKYAFALQHAASGGHESIIKRLLIANADIEGDQGRGTPLHCAIKNCQTTAVKTLIMAGANVNARCRETTTLSLAVNHGSIEIVDILLASGANLNEYSYFDLGAEPPLFTAARRGNLSIVRKLLEHGANVNEQIIDGWTALHRAASGGHPEILRVLVQDHHADTTLGLINGSLALHSAASTNYPECIEVLLDAGVDINEQNHTGRTALHWAVDKGSKAAVAFLIKKGARLDIESEDSQITPLDLAKWKVSHELDDKNMQEVVEILEKASMGK